MSLKIIICIKSVVTSAPEGRVVRTMDNCILNPFDRPAIEMALRLRETEGGTVTAVTMGPETGTIALYEALSMGVDRAVLVTDRAFAGSDTLATSKTLSAAINRLKPFDLVIFGARSSDSDTGQVGPQTAVFLDLPVITGVKEITRKGDELIVERHIDEYSEKYSLRLPGVVAVHPRAMQPRDAALSMVEKAFKKDPIEKVGLKDLGISSQGLGESGSPTRLVSMSKIKRKKKCEFINGSPEEQADELVKRIKSGGYLS
ncbi:MAG: electron transfer flavoprotein subunit beta/FixA family protein [Deltaproteobacteria bacterium]|nr:electron transfer flavoprotein subunit beta/FixA family protein [Deltaproteobacteria bacterium]